MTDMVGCHLREVCASVDYGFTASAADQPVGPRFLRITDIVGSALNWEQVPYASVSEKERSKYKLHHDDIVIARTGATTGESAYISNPPEAVFASYLVRLKIKPEVNPRFVAYWLKSSAFKNFIYGVLGEKSAQPNASASTMTLAPFRYPRSRATQDAIVAILASLDDKIELNRRMNETLEAQARALFRDWFVDFGPVKAKMAGDIPYLALDLWSLFPNRLDDDGVPEGWHPATLDTFATCRNRKANPDEVDDGTAYIGLEHMPRRSIALSEWEGAEKVTSAKSRFRRREILFGKLRPYFHKVGIAPIDGICSTDIVVLAPKKERFEALTLACASTDEFVAFTDQSSTGTKMPRTSWKIMRTYPMVKPSDTIADAFQSICEPMIDRILANIEENQTLAQTRDLLLPKLMSGEIRVSEAERQIEEAR